MSEPTEAARKRRHRKERIAAATTILIVAAVAIGIVAWERSSRDGLVTDTAYIPRKVVVTPEVELLTEYVRIDTSTPEGSARGARWIAAQLQKRGIAHEVIESAPGRLNVYARIRGRNRGEGLILFHHIDVVPPGKGKWDHPPFAASIVGDEMFGRGTLDMKSIAIGHLAAFADAARAGAPAHDLVFLATADEETGSEFGMRWLVEHRPDIFADIRYGLTEGGITETVREEVTYFGIEIGGKQYVELDVVGPDLDSMRRARFALEPYMFPREAQRVLPEIANYTRSIAPTRVAFRRYLEDIDRTISQGQFWRLPVTYRDLFQNTVGARAPVQKNGRWTMTVALLNLPDELPDERIAAIAKIVAPFGVTLGEVRVKEGPVPLSRSDTRLFQIVAAEARRRYNAAAGVHVLFRSATDSRFLRPRGIICYGIAPHIANYFASSTIHGNNERVRVPSFVEGVEFTKKVVSEWARGTT